jgi:hypothetical protein
MFMTPETCVEQEQAAKKRLFVSLFLRQKHAITPALVWGTCLTFIGSVLIILSR